MTAPTTPPGETLKLGLIGDNIDASLSPRLHRLAGAQNGVAVRYDRLVPPRMGQSLQAILAQAPAQGYRGVNVTYPYKERAAALVRIDDPMVRAIGAINTVLFEPGGPVGYSTDYSGFIDAYRQTRGDSAPGEVLMIGTGGVGRAVAFGLITLGARGLRLVDRDRAKALALADDLRKAKAAVDISVHDTAEAGAAGADGLINCTPLGMVGHPGTPLPRAAMAGASWVFDAVYTPVNTQFLQDAKSEGLAIIPGWELFFFQGVHAWALFSGLPLEAHALRADLLNAESAA